MIKLFFTIIPVILLLCGSIKTETQNNFLGDSTRITWHFINLPIWSTVEHGPVDDLILSTYGTVQLKWNTYERRYGFLYFELSAIYSERNLFNYIANHYFNETDSENRRTVIRLIKLINPYSEDQVNDALKLLISDLKIMNQDPRINLVSSNSEFYEQLKSKFE
jgi:hypothetical protein